jgi:hypothetical protein
MKKILLLWALCSFVTLAAAQDGTSNAAAYALPDSYPSDSIPAEFGDKFKTEDEKKNFKNLRTFLSDKEGLLLRLQSSSALLHRDNPSMISSSQTIVTNLVNLLNSSKAADSIRVDIGDVTNNFQVGWYPFYEYQSANKQIIYLPVSRIRQKISEVNSYLASAQENVKKAKTVDGSIRRVKQDIDDCRRQIDIALAPEYKQQDFRTTISLYFTALIALVLLMFFLVIHRNAASTLSTQLLSDNGLQFVTLFVLIIAVVLFGILNILQSSELAAILAGISGYILGRGNNQPAAGGTGS